MTSLAGFPRVVFELMIHNLPFIEAIVIVPILLRKYSWVLVTCLLVLLGTFGVELRNHYDLKTWFSGGNLIILLSQATVGMVVSATVFLIKTRLMKAMVRRNGGSGESTRP
jgi:hypothetical protein